MSLLDNKWINKDSEYYQSISDYLLSDDHTLILDADNPEIPGRRYQSYANALVYINANGGASYYNRWVCNVSNTITEDIALSPFVFITSATRSGVVIGKITTAGTSNSNEAYRASDIIFDSADPIHADNILTVINSIIVSQDDTAGAGTLWIRNTAMFKDGALSKVDTSSLKAFEITEGSQVSYQGDFSKLNVRTGSYVTLVGSNTGGTLNLYDGATSLYMTDGTTLTLGSCYCYKGSMYGTGYGFGTNPKVIVNTDVGYPSEVIDCILYGVDYEVSGAGNILKLRGVVRGSNNNTEVFTEVSSGTLQIQGEIFESSLLTSKDTVSAINELASSLAGLSLAVEKITADGNAEEDKLTIVDGDNGAIVVSLPATSTLGKSVFIKANTTDIIANPITVSGNGNLIDGVANYVIGAENQSLRLVSDGTNWFVI